MYGGVWGACDEWPHAAGLHPGILGWGGRGCGNFTYGAPQPHNINFAFWGILHYLVL